MAEKEVQETIQQLHTLSPHSLNNASSLLSRAKLSLLKLNALIPTPQTSTQHLQLAREVLELGALISIRQKDPQAFTRYFQQLQPFYSLPAERWGGHDKSRSNQSKVTGLHLLLLLSQGDYAAFHTVIEGLEMAHGGKQKLEEDAFIQYPMRLEQALMEGSYDRVWGETKGERVPSEEFAVFSEVLVNTIRSEIASCSERAYPSLPISNAKNLLFLDSEGAVIQFAQSRGWLAKEGRIYFPQQQEEMAEGQKDILAVSGQVIENTLEYARKLETIV
ncbi:SAC3/GANP/Nin1/mts3/eIF-3 p25 family-domain-containing protein [Delphinella strobiligena]|nr:SAC3/GANP/Nin1/mts3/eIF-3 p25 family-domain-containing protein [Delphinella strobiligena]